MSKKIIESYRRKLATEEGWTLKRGSAVRVALCYPNVYGVGMANLGFHAVYELFNNIPDVSCERVFLPDEAEMREYEKSGAALLSLESQSPVRGFDVIAFGGEHAAEGGDAFAQWKALHPREGVDLAGGHQIERLLQFLD